MAKIPPNSHRLLQAWRSHLAFGRNVRSDRPLDGDVCICKIVIEFGGIFAIVFPACLYLIFTVVEEVDITAHRYADLAQ